MFNNVFPANVLSVYRLFCLSIPPYLKENKKKQTHPPYETKQTANLNIHQVSFPFLSFLIYFKKGIIIFTAL